MKRLLSYAILCVVGFVFINAILLFTIAPNHFVQAQAPPGVLLVLAGDWDDSFPGATQSTLQTAVAAGPDLIGFVGDLSYNGSNTNQAAGIATANTWCSKVKPILGSIPTFFTPGDHDSWLQDGDVTTYIGSNCLGQPTVSSKVSNFQGTYPWRYYFDVTDGGTTVRVVGGAGDASGDLASAYPSASSFMTGYEKNGASYAFLSQAFTDAKNKGYWTVFVNHEPCIDAGKDNPAGADWCGDIVDLLADTGVDVMVTGSSHNAWLTKQVNKYPGCSTINLNGKGTFNPACVKQVANNAYIEGQGWVNAHAGTGGKDGSSSYDCFTGPDVPFLVPGTCGSDASDGAVHLSFTASSLQGTFKKNSGGNLYSFSMTRSGVPPPASIAPTSPTTSVVPTGGGSGTRISLQLFLHAIGKGGDNLNPNSTGNMNPLRSQRSVSVDMYNTSNQLVGTRQGTVTYNSAAGNFQGIIDLGNVANGFYTMKVKTPQYLVKGVPGIITVTSGQLYQAPALSLIVGDTNADNRLSVLDYNMLLDCFSDLLPAKNCTDANKKQLTDFNDDGSVNQIDYNFFLRELSVQGGE